MQKLNVTRWPVALVFLGAGLTAVVSAFCTVNLYSETVANFDFINQYGEDAIMLGALWQTAGLVVWGGLALACFIGFKICESELVRRYRIWAGSHH